MGANQFNIRISVVSPVYRGEKVVAELVRRNVETLMTLTDDYEIILVNDASPDMSWKAIETECQKNPRVKGLNLSRNFGQHYAITAGLAYATGDWVVVMDCDLQDRPEEIPNLFRKAQEGYDIVYAQRKNKQFSIWKKMSSYMHHKIVGWLSGSNSDASISNFGIYKKCVIDEFNRMPERARAFHYMVDYLGFKSAMLKVQHAESGRGGSSYSFRKLLRLSTDIIIANSNKPLRMAVGLGFTMSVVSFLLALYNVVAKLVGIIEVSGYTTTVFSIWFVGGLLLLVTGILGLYIGKIFDQVKGRQLFVVRDKVNLE